MVVRLPCSSRATGSPLVRWTCRTTCRATGAGPWFRDGCCATSSTSGGIASHVGEAAVAPVSKPAASGIASLVEEAALAAVSKPAASGIASLVEEGALAAVSKPATSGNASLVEEGRSPVSKPAARSSDSWCLASSPTAAARRASKPSADPSTFKVSAPWVTAAPKARASARSSSAVTRMVPEKETRFSSIVTCRPTAAARASAARAGSYDAAATTWATGAAAPTPARSGASPTPSTCPAPHRPFETGLAAAPQGSASAMPLELRPARRHERGRIKRPETPGAGRLTSRPRPTDPLRDDPPRRDRRTESQSEATDIPGPGFGCL